MLGSLSPPGYSLIRASLFPRVRAAFCCLLSNSLRHLQGLSSPKFFAATSPQLPAAQGHWFLEDPSYFQLPLANTDAWKEALKKSFVVQGLVSWCSESYLINSSFRPLAPAPVQQAGRLAPVGAQKCPKRPGETTLSLCWASSLCWSWGTSLQKSQGEAACPVNMHSPSPALSEKRLQLEGITVLKASP